MAVPTLDPFMMGKHFTAITVTPLTPNPSTGVLTSATPLNVYAVFDELDHTTEEDFDDVRPSWSLQKNMVLTGTGDRVRLTTFKVYNAGQKLSDLKQAYTHARLQWTAGKESYDGYFAVGRFGNPNRGYGAQRVTLDFEPVNPGSGVPQMSRAVAA